METSGGLTQGRLEGLLRLSSELYQSSFRRKPISQLNAETSRAHPESARVLTLTDLVAIGVSGTLGAGLFFLLGRVARNEVGPAVSVSFLFAAGVCALVGLSYAEMVSRVPSCGSAYSFSYTALGELCAFIVGWCLSLEYGIASAAIARSWAAYVRHGLSLSSTSDISDSGLSFLGALFILVLTILLASGLREGRYIVGISTVVFGVVILAVFVFGSHLVRPANWVPFMPHGWRSVVLGSSSLFFAYVGFDEVATVAEEAHSPSRNVPRAMMISLAIVSGICALASVIITGIQPYSELSESAPFAGAFEYAGSTTFAKIVSIGTVIGLQNTAIVALLAQPRLFVAMSRDGLLPEIFGELSGAGSTPRAATILCGIGLAVVALLFPLHSLADMISGGTLIAYTAVCVSLIRTRLIVSGHGRDSGGLLTLLLVSFTLCALIWRVGNEGITSLLGGGFIAGVPLLLLGRVPLACEPDPPAFICPMVPWIPAIGAFFSTVLLFQLSHTGLFLLLIWILIGFFIYAVYGFKHSHTRYILPPDFVAAAPSSWRGSGPTDVSVESDDPSRRQSMQKHRPSISAGDMHELDGDRPEFQQVDLLDDIALDVEDETESFGDEVLEFTERSE
ncbi:hypothetical protein CCYA_CCYA14G3798 [Cyanidiococcus yangmingshanensis]|nr:hypothetical protein CCYA_CCYA14G3798 [Cyanidiococcus yangmingshanensis]